MGYSKYRCCSMGYLVTRAHLACTGRAGVYWGFLGVYWGSPLRRFEEHTPQIASSPARLSIMNERALQAANEAAEHNVGRRARQEWRGLCFCGDCTRKDGTDVKMRCNYITLKAAARHWGVREGDILGAAPGGPMFSLPEDVLYSLRSGATGRQAVQEVRGGRVQQSPALLLARMRGRRMRGTPEGKHVLQGCRGSTLRRVRPRG